MVKALLPVYYSVHDLSAAIATSVLISPPNRIHPPIHPSINSILPGTLVQLRENQLTWKDLSRPPLFLSKFWFDFCLTFVNYLFALPRTYHIEDITRWREDMNFIFECQNNILRTSAASE